MLQKFKDPKAVQFLTMTVAVFIGSIIALCWNNIVESLVSLLMDKMPGAAIIAAIGSALVVTVLGFVLGITFLNKLNAPETPEAPAAQPVTPEVPAAPATQPEQK
jgi:Na+/citrate or Na+/malate symporter